MITWLKRFIKGYGARVAFMELQNLFYVFKIIREHKNTADWKKFGLRHDWIGRIYTVLNPLSPGDDGDSMEVLRIKYAERLKPINLYLDKIGLGLSITIAHETVKDTKSYLIVYSPIFNYITTWRVFVFMIFWVVFFATRLDSWTWSVIAWLWNILMAII
jgi:hypothetical protein